MLQRIGLAQALIHDPRLVVLDEPTAGVDPAGSREIRDLIMDLKHRGITVLLSSHLLAQAQEICDRIGILADGVLVREGRLQELIAIENQTELVIADASDELDSTGLNRSSVDRMRNCSNGENRPPHWKDCSWNRPEGRQELTPEPPRPSKTEMTVGPNRFNSEPSRARRFNA